MALGAPSSVLSQLSACSHSSLQSDIELGKPIRLAKMTLVGLMPVPEGETADFHGTSDLQITILAVYITTSVLATFGLILRLYTGARLVRNLGLDACELATRSALSHHGLDYSVLTWLASTSLPRGSMGRLPRLLRRHGEGHALRFR